LGLWLFVPPSGKSFSAFSPDLVFLAPPFPEPSIQPVGRTPHSGLALPTLYMAADFVFGSLCGQHGDDGRKVILFRGSFLCLISVSFFFPARSPGTTQASSHAPPPCSAGGLLQFPLPHRQGPAPVTPAVLCPGPCSCAAFFFRLRTSWRNTFLCSGGVPFDLTRTRYCPAN